jgi:hypothetical protein
MTERIHIMWAIVTGTVVIAMIVAGTFMALEYNKTMQVAFQNGYSNTQGWRK